MSTLGRRQQQVEKEGRMKSHLVKEFKGNNGGLGEEVQEEEEEVVWPVEHPMEPMDEDRPVICPIPTSSLLPQEGRRDQKKKVEMSWRKRAENPVAIAAAMPIMINNINVDHRLQVAEADRSIGVVRKRHHTHSSRRSDVDDYRIHHDHHPVGFRRSVTLPLPPNNNIANTIFHMLRRAP